MDGGALLDEAERAVGAGDFDSAIRLLKQAAKQDPDNSELWLRIAAVQRGRGQPRPALDAVHRALSISPLDFTALMLRASLLDTLNDPAAPEAWGNALANKPGGELPPPLAVAVARGEQRHAQWLAERDRRMAVAMATTEASAGADERRRIERFRSNVLRRTGDAAAAATRRPPSSTRASASRRRRRVGEAVRLELDRDGPHRLACVALAAGVVKTGTVGAQVEKAAHAVVNTAPATDVAHQAGAHAATPVSTSGASESWIAAAIRSRTAAVCVSKSPAERPWVLLGDHAKPRRSMLAPAAAAYERSA